VLETRHAATTRAPRDYVLGAAVTYQRELVQCGKAKCRKWHGPYWYAYWTAGSRTRTIYVGKELRPAREVLDELKAKRRERAAAAARSSP
jgi:hypothetical protein